MKTSNLKYLVFASILFLSCGKSPAPDVKPFLKMDINGQHWLPDSIPVFGMYPEGILKDTDFQVTLSAQKYITMDSAKYLDEGFAIYLVKKQKGKQIIFGAPFFEMYYNIRHYKPTTPVYGYFETLQQYGEFTCEEFMVDSTKSADNWIEITKEEGNFKKIWGKFNVNFKRVAIRNGCPDPKYAADTRVSNGEFYLEL